MACFDTFFQLVKRRNFQSKSGFFTQENMFGVSFKQWKSPAHKQGQRWFGEPMGCIALGIRESYM